MALERHLTTSKDSDYSLIDSGEHEKLERYGSVIIARPDTQAIWKKQNPAMWSDAHAYFSWHGGKGSWEVTTPVEEPWQVRFNDMVLTAKLTAFKHTGIFPEQEPNWQWVGERLASLSSPSVLNLFGYTGAASLSAALHGASVTHVDSSKTSTTWAKDNAQRSGLSEDAIRFIVEDVRSFVKREVRRGATYDGILLDPPAFGRGTKDEVWKIEEDLLPLLEDVKQLLKESPGSFLLLNGYAAGYAPHSFLQLVESVFGDISAEYGELRIQEETGRALSAGMYVRFVR